jgi:hypothetical protein
MRIVIDRHCSKSQFNFDIEPNFTQLLFNCFVWLLFGAKLNLMGIGLGYGFQLLTYAQLSKPKCVSTEKFFK